MIDIRQTSEYGNYLEKLGWIIERRAGINYFIKKIPILGGVLKIQRPEEIKINIIRKIARKYGIFQIIIEPKNGHHVPSIKYHGFKLSKSPYLPTKTLLLDLTKTKDELLGGLKKDAKRAVKRSRGGIKEPSSSKELAEFRNAWKKIVGFRRFVPPVDHLLALKKSFRQNPPLFLTSHNNNAEIIGGAIFTRSSKKISYYWQAFSSKEARASLSQYSLVWNGILWAKQHGCKIFDFEGIYDSRFPNKSWHGFSHFKKAFGGYEVPYPGAFVKYRIPI
jgi:hypothetical protein